MLLSTALLAPLFAVSSPQDEVPRGQVDWFVGSYEAALAEAEAQGKLLLIEFYADWCGWCQQHEKSNLTDENVLTAMGDFVCFGADLSQDADGNIADKAAERLMNRFAVRRFPGIVFVGPDDRPEDLISGYLPTKRLLDELARVSSGKNSVSDYERRLAASPDDLELRFQYAIKLDMLGDYPGYDEQIAVIVAKDPDSVSLPRRRMALGLMREQLWGCMRDPEIDPDPTELRAFLAEAKYPEIICNGWLLMAIVEDELQNEKAAREAYRRAWKHVPADLVAPVGNGIAWGFWTQRDELTPADKRWALEVSEKATRAFEAKSTDPVAIAGYVDTLACCYYMNGKRKKALELMRRCMEMAPDDPTYSERYELFKSRS